MPPVRLDDLEVVWPLHRSHYLSPALTDEDFIMRSDPLHSDPVSVDETPPPPPDALTPGRELAVRALLAGADCLQQRVSDLLGVSRRTIGRMADADLSAALLDPQALEGARTCLADTASRGSTAEEREAAVAWLEHVVRDEHHAARAQALRRRPPGPRPGAGRRPSGNRGAHHNGNGHGPGRVTAPTPPTSPAAATVIPSLLPPIEALQRQQQRILHRTALVDYVLTAETRGGGPLTMGDALAELLADITEAARTMGALLQTATGRPSRQSGG